FTDTLELDLATVEPSLAGPKRPQDRVPLRSAKSLFTDALQAELARAAAAAVKGTAARTAASSGAAAPGATAASVATDPNAATDGAAAVEMNGQRFTLRHGAVVIAAITSCTN